MSWPACIAHFILGLEHYDVDGIISVLNSQMFALKLRDLDAGVTSEKRDALKFFRKRTSCKCLKKMHLEARKSTPKMGLCWHCEQEKERVSLSVCSRCMTDQYCSRECQIENSIHISAFEFFCFIRSSCHCSLIFSDIIVGHFQNFWMTYNTQ